MGPARPIFPEARQIRAGLARIYSTVLSIWGCEKGFSVHEKVIGIDGIFLKGPYKGVMLVPTTQDDDNKCYPIAWGIIDLEDKDA